MLQRLDAMDSELGALIESLRTGSNRLNADVQLLEGNLTDLTDAASTRPRFEPEDDYPGADAEPAVVVYEEAEELEVEAVAPASIVDEGPAPGAAIEGDTDTEDLAEASDDTEGARLIALNMALNGTPREETDRYLADNFRLPDRRGLLDEVYSSVE
jgi:hypothetical protein